MKYFILLLLLCVVSATSAQKIIKIKRASRHTIHVFGDCFEGVVFKKGYNKKLTDTSKYIEFTPTKDEIELAERFLNQYLDTLKDETGISSLINQQLSIYTRQYWGYINEKGEKILYLNAFRDGDIYRNKKYWLKKPVMVWDGGYRFWRIEFSLNKLQLFHFSVNG